MNGIGLQDSIIRSLSDAGYRRSAANPALHIASVESLNRAARFLARRYYVSRVGRFYQKTGQLSHVSGRIPARALQGRDVDPILDAAVLGSRETAESIAACVDKALKRVDAEIVARIPYWRELVRYDSSYFLAEARSQRPVSEMPLANPDALTIDFDWDLFRELGHSGEQGIPEIPRQKTTLVFCCDSKGAVSVTRPTDVAMQLMALADGTRSLVALAEAVNYPQQRTDALVECLRKTGALL